MMFLVFLRSKRYTVVFKLLFLIFISLIKLTNATHNHNKNEERLDEEEFLSVLVQNKKLVSSLLAASDDDDLQFPSQKHDKSSHNHHAFSKRQPAPHEPKNYDSNGKFFHELAIGELNRETTDKRRAVKAFIGKLLGINECKPELLEYETQMKLRHLKSIVSTCANRCRVAMGVNGHVFATKHFSLDSKHFLSLLYSIHLSLYIYLIDKKKFFSSFPAIWQKVMVDTVNFVENGALLGAYYMKFVASGKYLCIDRKGSIYSSVI